MKKIIASIATLLSLATPAAALNPPSKAPAKPTQATVNRVYLKILNQALTKGAPAYLNVSNQDKISYGHYTCQALNAKVPLDTVFIDYIQAVGRDVPPELHSQAAYFIGSSMGAGVQSFCPKYLPQLSNWIKARGGFARQ